MSQESPAVLESPSVQDTGRLAAVPIPGLRRLAIIIAIFAGNGAGALIFDALPPILPRLAQYFGGGHAGELMAQLAHSLPISGLMLSGLFSGLLVERFGVRPVLLVAMAVFGLAGSAGYIIDDGQLLLASRFIMGLSVGVAMTTCATLVAMRYEGSERARMNGFLVAVGAFSGVIWILISGQVATSFTWRAPFLLHAIWALLMMVPALMMGRFKPERPAARPMGAAWGSGLRRLLPVAPIYLLAGASFMVSSMFSLQLSFIMVSLGASDPAAQSHVLSLTPMGVAAMAFAYGWVEKRVGWVGLLKASYAMVALALLMVFLAPSPAWLAAAGGIDGVALGIMLPSLWMLAMQRAPHDLIPRALGLMSTALYLGATLNPLVLAPLREAVGRRGQFLAAALVVIAVLAAVEAWERLRRPRSPG